MITRSSVSPTFSSECGGNGFEPEDVGRFFRRVAGGLSLDRDFSFAVAARQKVGGGGGQVLDASASGACGLAWSRRSRSSSAAPERGHSSGAGGSGRGGERIQLLGPIPVICAHRNLGCQFDAGCALIAFSCSTRHDTGRVFPASRCRTHCVTDQTPVIDAAHVALLSAHTENAWCAQGSQSCRAARYSSALLPLYAPGQASKSAAQRVKSQPDERSFPYTCSIPRAATRKGRRRGPLPAHVRSRGRRFA